MTTIKSNFTDIIESLQDHYNKTFESDMDLLNGYVEIYLKYKGTDLYIKTKEGKKTVYKKIDYFFTNNAYQNLDICIREKGADNHLGKIEFNTETFVEGRYRYRVYKSTETPAEGGIYFDVDTRATAMKLSESLNKKDNCSNWVWA